MDHHECHDPLVFPGTEWTDGDFAAPLPTPPVPGPYDFPEDEELLRWWLCFVAHCRVLSHVYAVLLDPKQRWRWAQAEECAMDVIRRVFPKSWRALAAQVAPTVASAMPITGTQAEEFGWTAHALTTIRKIEIAWRTGNGVKLASVVRCREMVCRSIRCSLPSD